jgi:hypothetical protein
MIEFLPESSGNVVGIKVGGALTASDYQRTLIPALDERLSKHGRLSIVFLMDETFTGWELGAAWDDAAYGLKHRADFGRIALVGGPTWVGWCIAATRFLIKGEVRTFPVEQLQQAWAWVKGNKAGAFQRERLR